MKVSQETRNVPANFRVAAAPNTCRRMKAALMLANCRFANCARFSIRSCISFFASFLSSLRPGRRGVDEGTKGGVVGSEERVAGAGSGAWGSVICDTVINELIVMSPRIYTPDLRVPRV